MKALKLFFNIRAIFPTNILYNFFLQAPGFDSVSQRDPYEETSSNKKFDPFGIGSVDPSNFDNSDVKSERLGGTGGFNPFGINTNNNNEARTELSPHESRSEKESENSKE